MHLATGDSSADADVKVTAGAVASAAVALTLGVFPEMSAVHGSSFFLVVLGLPPEAAASLLGPWGEVVPDPVDPAVIFAHHVQGLSYGVDKDPQSDAAADHRYRHNPPDHSGS